ncbi:MAG: PAS domain S-box protein [Rhodothermales bacterium]|nr:PAS domain S-box protein [Rhodothermales bacterium]
MLEFLRSLFDSRFMPHGHCYQWLPELVWLHVVSDAAIVVAYFVIPAGLIYFVKKREDLHFSGVFWLFGAFILLCGLTHAFGIWSVWHGTYRLTGLMKAATGLVSLATAGVLFYVIPQALRLPSFKTMERYTAELQQEVERHRATRNELDHFFELSIDLLCLATPDGYFKRINPAFQTVLGYSREELLARPFLDLVHPDDVEATLAEMEKLSAGEPTIHFENRYRCSDGAYRWLAWRAQPFADVIYAVAREVTEEKHRNAMLEQQTLLLKRGEEMAQVGHWRVDLVRGTVTWSDEVYRIHGRDPETFTPTLEAGINAYHPDDRERVSTYVQRAIEQAERFEFELRIVQPSGEVRHVVSRGECAVGAGGAVEALFGVFIDVTDRKRAELALRRSEARYRHLYNRTPVMLHSIDAEGKLISVSDYWLEKMGYEREDVLGRRSTEFLTEESQQRAKSILKAFYRTGYSLNTPYQFVKRDGEVMDVLLSAVSERDEAGRVVRSLAVIVDVTERTRAEAALRRSENRFRLLHHITTQADRPFEEQIEEVLRLTTELFDLDIGIMSHIEGDRYTVVAASTDALEAGQTFPLGTTYCSMTYAADDVVAIEHMSISPHRRHPCYEAFGLEAYIGIPITVRGRRYGTLNFSGAAPREGRFDDGAREFVRMLGQWVAAILARREGDEALRLSEERYRLLFENAPEAIAIQNADRVLAANAACARLLAAESPSAVVGVDPYRVILPEDRALVEREVAAMMASGAPSPRVPLRYRRFDGEVIDVEVVATPTRWEGEAAMQILIADVTERNRAKAALERSNRELEQFAYVASHDLQEPLRTISSYVRLLEKRYQGRLDEDADDFIAYIVDGAGRMQALIRDLLSYSRAGRREIRRVPVALGEALDQTLVGMQGRIDESGARITRGPLPTVRADATQMILLLQNLISNGIKFRGEAVPEVHVSSERSPEGWRIAVKDNGIGIQPEHQHRIFEVFKRLQSRRTYEGTGIGLAICKKIVERHGGRLWVESEPGHGATFFFTLPAAGAEPAPDAHPRPARRGQPERHPADAGGL